MDKNQSACVKNSTKLMTIQKCSKMRIFRNEYTLLHFHVPNLLQHWTSVLEWKNPVSLQIFATILVLLYLLIKQICLIKIVVTFSFLILMITKLKLAKIKCSDNFGMSNLAKIKLSKMSRSTVSTGILSYGYKEQSILYFLENQHLLSVISRFKFW